MMSYSNATVSGASLERWGWGGDMLGGIRGGLAARWRRLVYSFICLAAATGLVATVAPGDAVASPRSAAPSAGPYSIALNYTIRFYPRFFTYIQQNLGEPNRLSGPDGMGPLYGAVPAPNDDTIYANFFLNLAQGPEILTIPDTQVTYSLLTTDVFGSAFQSGIQSRGGDLRAGPRGGTVPRLRESLR